MGLPPRPATAPFAPSARLTASQSVDDSGLSAPLKKNDAPSIDCRTSPARPAARSVPPAKSTSAVAERLRTDSLTTVHPVALPQPSVVRAKYEPLPSSGKTAHCRWGFAGSPVTRRRNWNPLPASAAFVKADPVTRSSLYQTAPKLLATK